MAKIGKKKDRPLFTLGYEGLYIDEFLIGVKKSKLELIVDIRKNPVSRKKGFSKRRLEEALSTIGVEYLHLGNLGVPTDWRKRAKAELITRKKMFSDYVAKILPKESESIEQITELAATKKVGLLCYERDASDCHRSFLAKKMSRHRRPKFEIVNFEI